MIYDNISDKVKMLDMIGPYDLLIWVTDRLQDLRLEAIASLDATPTAMPPEYMQGYLQAMKDLRDEFFLEEYEEMFGLVDTDYSDYEY